MPARTADIVPGTRGRTSAADLWIDTVEDAAKGLDWVVQHDMPYQGGFTTGHYGQPASGVHVVQLEIARRLYMDEQTLARLEDGFPRVTAFASELVGRLVHTAEKRVATAAIPAQHGPGVS
jgi:N-formylglutamate amidohydrolase